MTVMFYSIAILIIVGFILTFKPEDVTLKDLPHGDAPDTSTKEPAKQETTHINSIKTVGDDKAQVDYYIIVESFRTITQAQQAAEKLKNNFDTNIIILPPSTEGYYRVCYGKYSTHEEADSAIKSIRTKIRYDAWIFSIRK